MKGIKFILHDKSKFHFGDSIGELKLNFSSDQLFSAIINNVALLYGDKVINETIKSFENGKISISSLYYGLDIISKKDNNIVKSIYFLSKPCSVIKSKINKGDEILLRKQIKKIQYMSTNSLKSLMSNWNAEKEQFEYDIFDLVFIGKSFVCTKEELDGLDIDKDKLENIKLLSIKIEPKVQIDRETSKSANFFYDEYLQIDYKEIDNYILRPFMYFLYKGEMTKELRTAISLLVDEGIGGKRSKGMGILLSVSDIQLNDINDKCDSEYYMNIATYYPYQHEVNSIIAYQLEKRNGYIYSQGKQPYRKRTVRIIKEGSIFNKSLSGQIINVTPKVFNRHKILLYGKAFNISMGGDSSWN